MKSPPSSQTIRLARDRLQKRFCALREIIRKELLEADKEPYAELAGRVHDLGDESVADLLADVNLAIIDHHIDEVRDIEATLLRISAGSYGHCTDCGELIDAARLDAYATATRCYPCQSRRERNYAQPSHPKL